MAVKNRVRLDKWLWDNFPPFFFIFIVVLVAFLIVGQITKAISIGVEFPAEKVDGGVLVPIIILAAWLFLFTASILVSFWKSGRSDKKGTSHLSGLNFPGGGASSQW